MKKLLNYFSKWEWSLWFSSIALVVLPQLMTQNGELQTTIASVIGVTSLILIAKGNPLGQVLMILFSLYYGYISWQCQYYGELITYVGMTAPMSLLSLISWLRHPYRGNRSQVAISNLTVTGTFIMILLTVIVTWAFYEILAYFHTANLTVSTISVTTSFIAVYLTYLRTPYFPLAYACNDIVLIALWLNEGFSNTKHLGILACFIVFLFNDIYCFVNWIKMKAKQSTKI